MNGEKKKTKPFTEQDLATKGYVEVKPGVWVKETAPGLQNKDGEGPSQIRKFVSAMEIPVVDKKRRHKYNTAKAEDRTHNGKLYDSKLEMQYRQHLELLEKAGDVIKIEEQLILPIDVMGKHICNYVLDFKVYYKDGSKQYIDCKGVKTSTYRLKKKLVEAIYPFTIMEVKRGDF